MHIIIGALSSIVTILWLLHRLAEMGIDLAGLNPWLWQRRRKWKRTYDANPVYSLDSPLEITALLVTATAKADGDMSSEEKHHLLELFERNFHLSKREAAGLLISSVYLLGDGEELRGNLKKVLAPGLANFTVAQAASAVDMMHSIARTGSETSIMQADLIRRASGILQAMAETQESWS